MDRYVLISLINFSCFPIITDFFYFSHKNKTSDRTTEIKIGIGLWNNVICKDELRANTEEKLIKRLGDPHLAFNHHKQSVSQLVFN